MTADPELDLDIIGDVDDDEEPVDVSDVSSAFVTDTDWTTETILSQMRRGNIHLNPRFQRRDAWTRAQKSRFVESLVLGLPIPQIVLAEDKRRKGSFIVLDGKQRLLTLSQFASGSNMEGAQNEIDRPLRLFGLEVRSDLNRTNLADLERDAEYIDDLNGFLNQTIRTVVVRNWPDEDFLNLVFLRLNTGSVGLSPQELRQALHPGPFTDFLDDYASDSKQLRRALKNPGPDFRMRDVEILLRHYALKTRLSSYRGSLKRFLDDTADVLNKDWDSSVDKIQSQATEFDLAIEATRSIFSEHAFHRWNPENHTYETRFNRAIFEIMVYYFSIEAVRESALLVSGEVKEAFEGLSQEKPAFTEAVQTTTKTVDALFTRLSAWGSKLDSVIAAQVPIPRLTENRHIEA